LAFLEGRRDPVWYPTRGPPSLLRYARPMVSLDSPPQAYLDELAPTPIIDSGHAEVRDFAAARSACASSAKEKAIRLYYAVRDEVRYDPYNAVVDVDSLRASATLESGRGWCVTKAVLLAAACRAVGIPARLGFADVRNHLSTARLREHMQSEIFYWHGYTSIGVGDGGRFVKATPAFNIELCEKFGFHPLEFDGENDSLYHPFDREGRKHMEYVNERGEFIDVPLEDMRETFADKYPAMSFSAGDGEGAFGADVSFERDVEAETSG
jgi:transglutaminase-like putative cysteine protease